MNISKFQFKNPRIKNLFIESHPNWKESSTSTINIHVDIKRQESKINIKNSAMVSLTLVIGSDDEETFPFYITMEIYSDFVWSNGFNDVEYLLNHNAPTLLISYARPIITLLTSQLGCPYNLPFLDFSKENLQ